MVDGTQVKLLILPGQGGLTDLSPAARTVTPHGGATLSTEQTWDGQPVIKLASATSSYLSLPASADYGPGSGDWTVEAVMRLTTLSGDTFLASFYNYSSSFAWALRLLYGGTSYGGLLYKPASGSAVDWRPATFTTGAWFHLAVSKAGSALRLFLNGTLVATATVAALFSLTDQLLIGAFCSSGSISCYTNGYLAAFRITSAALYTVAFTPPATRADFTELGVPHSARAPVLIGGRHRARALNAGIRGLHSARVPVLIGGHHRARTLSAADYLSMIQRARTVLALPSAVQSARTTLARPFALHRSRQTAPALLMVHRGRSRSATVAARHQARTGATGPGRLDGAHHARVPVELEQRHRARLPGTLVQRLRAITHLRLGEQLAARHRAVTRARRPRPPIVIRMT